MSERKAGTPGIDPDLVRELAAILRDSGLTELELEQAGLKLKLSRTVTVAAAPVQHSAPAPTLAAAISAVPHPVSAPSDTPTTDWKAHPGMVPSPMVGTAYLSPEPGAAPFVKVGDMVSEGQTLVIVEAMKTFNPIPAPRAGKLTRLLVTDAQPVEYGEPLAIIE